MFPCLEEAYLWKYVVFNHIVHTWQGIFQNNNLNVTSVFVAKKENILDIKYILFFFCKFL